MQMCFKYSFIWSAEKEIKYTFVKLILIKYTFLNTFLWNILDSNSNNHEKILNTNRFIGYKNEMLSKLRK